MKTIWSASTVSMHSKMRSTLTFWTASFLRSSCMKAIWAEQLLSISDLQKCYPFLSASRGP